MNQKERMLAGLPYKAWLDGLKEERMENKLKIYDYNLTRPDNKKKDERNDKKYTWKNRRRGVYRTTFPL